MTKFGLKVGPSVTREYLEAVRDSADFIEAYAHPDCDYDVLKYWDKPIMFHVAHSDQGTNFANPDKYETNIAALLHAYELADKFGAEKIVFHPELFENEKCTIDVLEKFIKKNFDSRLHLENMPATCKGVRHIATSAEEVKAILDRLQVKFCLDIAHATEYLTSMNVSRDKISEYFALGPNHIHVTDTDLLKITEPDFDEMHVSFGEGTMDMSWVRSLLPRDADVTLETPMHTDKHHLELEFMRNSSVES